MKYQQYLSAMILGTLGYWIDEMKSQGYEMIEVRQGAKTMSNPMKQLEADLIDKKINYNNNPVLKWCLTNTAVKRDENDNIRPIKRKTTKSKNRRYCKSNHSLLCTKRKTKRLLFTARRVIIWLRRRKEAYSI